MYLRRVLIDHGQKIERRVVDYIIRHVRDNLVHGIFRFVEQNVQPIFHTSAAYHRAFKRNGFAFSGHHPQSRVVFGRAVRQFGDVLEKTEQIRLNGMRVGRLAENLQQHRVGDEIEPREYVPLLVQIPARESKING